MKEKINMKNKNIKKTLSHELYKTLKKTVSDFTVEYEKEGIVVDNLEVWGATKLLHIEIEENLRFRVKQNFGYYPPMK